MTKKEKFPQAYFSHQILKNLVDAFKLLCGRYEFDAIRLATETGNTHWKYDNFEDFYREYKQMPDYAWLTLEFTERGMAKPVTYELNLTYYSNTGAIHPHTEVSIRAAKREQIEQIFEILEVSYEQSKLPSITEVANEKVTIFIGHGGSQQWRDLKDHLTDKHHYKVEAYETGARAGHTIRDILDDMLKKSSFALLVLSAEDEMADGEMRARQNVIHETGLFQGKLGFSRAIVLLEAGAAEFSNIAGVQQLRYGKGNIKEIFGEVLATLKREFDS